MGRSANASLSHSRLRRSLRTHGSQRLTSSAALLHEKTSVFSTSFHVRFPPSHLTNKHHPEGGAYLYSVDCIKNNWNQLSDWMIQAYGMIAELNYRKNTA